MGLALVAGAAASPATAAPRISLITLPPGAALPFAFGHTLLRVDADGDLATTGDQRLYEWGQWSVDIDLSLENLPALKAFALGMLDGEMDARRGVRAWGATSAKLLDRGFEDVLRLDDAAAARLVALLEEEFGAAGGEMAGAGPAPAPPPGYRYHHFLNNCATVPRDRIFAVLAPERRARLEGERSDRSPKRRFLVLADVKKAIDAGGPLATVPPAERAAYGDVLEALGVPLEIARPTDVLALADEAARRLEALLTLAGGAAEVRAAHGRFVARMDERLSTWDQAYSPARVRALLLAEGLLEPLGEEGGRAEPPAPAPTPGSGGGR